VADAPGNSLAVEYHADYDGFGKATEVNAGWGDRNKYPAMPTRWTRPLLRPGPLYDPATGRWNSEDPIVFRAGDPNLYRYVGNSPTNAVDPTGLQKAGDPFRALSYSLSPARLLRGDAHARANSGWGPEPKPEPNLLDRVLRSPGWGDSFRGLPGQPPVILPRRRLGEWLEGSVTPARPTTAPPRSGWSERYPWDKEDRRVYTYQYPPHLRFARLFTKVSIVLILQIGVTTPFAARS